MEVEGQPQVQLLEEEEDRLPELLLKEAPPPPPPSLVRAGTSSSLASASAGTNASTAMTSLRTSTKLCPRVTTSQDMNLSGEMRGKGESNQLCHRATINNNIHPPMFSHPARNFNLQAHSFNPQAHNFNLQDLNSSPHHFNSFNSGSRVKQKLHLDGIHTSSLIKVTMHSPQYGGLLLVQEVVDHQKSLGALLALGDPRSPGDLQAQVDPRSLRPPPAG